MLDPITDTDLIAYVDGQLDTMRRLEVEAHLARNPEDAARVMADLRDRDAMREAFASAPDMGPDHLRLGARRIDRAMAWQRVGARLRRAAVIVVLVGAGWLAHTEIGTFGVPDTYASTIDPELAEEARQARQAAVVRARAPSQPAARSYDRADLQAATGLDLPVLPDDWSVRDVQVFPGRHGTGVEITVDAKNLGEVSLFATRNHVAAGIPDEIARFGDGLTSYWRNGNTAYALSGPQTEGDLAKATSVLAPARIAIVRP